MTFFKKLDKEYPYLIIAVLIGVGSIFIATLMLGYIQRPRIIGFAMVGEGFYLYYKRYVKKTQLLLGRMDEWCDKIFQLSFTCIKTNEYLASIVSPLTIKL